MHNGIFCFFARGEITYGPRSPAVLQVKQVVKLEDPSGAIVGLKIKLTILDILSNLTFPLRFPAVLTYALCRAFWIIYRIEACLMVRYFKWLMATLFHAKHFQTFLSLVFRSCGLDSSKYKGHSFRIGAATFAASCGFSDAQIRAMGRWKSDVFRKYIRLSNIPSSTFRG